MTTIDSKIRGPLLLDELPDGTCVLRLACEHYSQPLSKEHVIFQFPSLRLPCPTCGEPQNINSLLEWLIKEDTR